MECFLIHCEEDDSFSVVPCEDITFDPSTIRVGDAVNFVYGKDSFRE